MTNLAALLHEYLGKHSGDCVKMAEWLLARGVQYAPRDAPEFKNNHWANVQASGGRPEGPSAPPPNFEELIAAARFALKECEEITSCYPNAGDFWGLADNAAQELRRALAGEAVSAFAKAVCAPPGPWFVCGPYGDIDHLNWRVEAPQRLSNGGYSKDEAFAVCHALNRIGSRPPEGT